MLFVRFILLCKGNRNQLMRYQTIFLPITASSKHLSLFWSFPLFLHLHLHLNLLWFFARNGSGFLVSVTDSSTEKWLQKHRRLQRSSALKSKQAWYSLDYHYLLKISALLFQFFPLILLIISFSDRTLVARSLISGFENVILYLGLFFSDVIWG